ncbi:5-oxoprolinase subunit PxpA [Brevibacillus composti]|uniref:5-oxoprolinase subunit PxpA n=1 Tax=Brevibacillus composti TaxID=2796470 RepID=A0A7T5JMB6_9BACL|nr:5-oxoprolinase subunit PxpA [Brevibacillus composti]QQE72932.1 5-oxoprolinase subunit PxpA [Brevibacillus composti]QUO40010.1 5-oxoprolinase subunit PxpA [Brevibacillus composti]
MIHLDINCDLAEGYGRGRRGEDLGIMKWITSVNIACGLHAGDPHIICRTVEAALRHGVKIGAHPGYPDVHGFGRRSMNLTVREVYELILYQVSALSGVTRALGGELHHVKLHGALYNEAAERPELAEAVARAISDIDDELIVYALSGSALVEAGLEYGLQVAEEVFADRAYLPNGRLAPRELEGSVLISKEEQMEQTRQLVLKQKVKTVDGTSIALAADTLCVHCESPDVLQFLIELHRWAKQNDIQLQAIAPR